MTPDDVGRYAESLGAVRAAIDLAWEMQHR
jgi:hypothetical protein